MPTESEPVMRLGQLIENVYGCLNGLIEGTYGGGRYCIYQLNEPESIRPKLEEALRQRMKPVPGG